MVSKNKLIIILVFLILLSGISYLAVSSELLLWDENAYLGNARSHLETSHYTEDFRFPLFEYYIFLFWATFGQSVLLAKMAVVLASFTLLISFYFLSKELTSHPLLATLLLSSTFVFLFWSFRVYADIFALLLVTISQLFYILYLKKNKLIFCAAGAIFLSLSFLARFSAVLFILPLGVLFLFRKDWHAIYTSVAASLLTLLPWLIYNLVKYSNPLWDLLAQSEIIATYTSFQSPLLFVLHLLKNFSFFLILLIPFFLSLKKKPYVGSIFLHLALLVQIVYFLFFINLKLERYVLAIAPLVILVLIQGFEYLYSKVSFKKTLYYIFTAAITFNLLLSFVSVLIHVEKSNDSILVDAIEYSNSLAEGELIISNNWPWFGFNGNHRVLSTYAPLNELIQNTTPSWVILFDNMGGVPYEGNISEEYLIKTFDNGPQVISIYDVSTS